MSLELANEYKDIAEKLVDKYPVNFCNINIDEILFIKETEKTPKKYAETRIVKSPYTFITAYRFIITVYENVCLNLNDAQKAILMMHELMHIGEDGLIDHDSKDFKSIIATYGVNWDLDNSVTNPLA
jgi:predicted metallopeptidase